MSGLVCLWKKTRKKERKKEKKKKKEEKEEKKKKEKREKRWGGVGRGGMGGGRWKLLLSHNILSKYTRFSVGLIAVTSSTDEKDPMRK